MRGAGTQGYSGRRVSNTTAALPLRRSLVPSFPFLRSRPSFLALLLVRLPSQSALLPSPSASFIYPARRGRATSRHLLQIRRDSY